MIPTASPAYLEVASGTSERPVENVVSVSFARREVASSFAGALVDIHRYVFQCVAATRLRRTSLLDSLVGFFSLPDTPCRDIELLVCSSHAKAPAGRVALLVGGDGVE